jgi:hypothetical protein
VVVPSGRRAVGWRGGGVSGRLDRIPMLRVYNGATWVRRSSFAGVARRASRRARGPRPGAARLAARGRGAAGGAGVLRFAAGQWDPVATEFARYGLDVLGAWIAKGMVYGRVRAMWGYGLPPAPVDWLDEDAIQALATDTVLVALDKFRTEVLMRHRWDPTKGATLKTFFIGQCLFRFANVYLSWYGAERGRRRHVIAAETDVLDLLPGSGRPDLVVAGRAQGRGGARPGQLGPGPAGVRDERRRVLPPGDRGRDRGGGRAVGGEPAGLPAPEDQEVPPRRRPVRW